MKLQGKTVRAIWLLPFLLLSNQILSPQNSARNSMGSYLFHPDGQNKPSSVWVDNSYGRTSQVGSSLQTKFKQEYGKLPMSFESGARLGNTDIKFIARKDNYDVYFQPTEIVLSPHKEAQPQDGNMRLILVNGNPKSKVTGLDELPGKSNYLIGSDAKTWQTGVTNYRKVKYQDVYPGIDLVFYGSGDQFEYDFIIAPGSNPKSISLAIDGAEGITTEENGDLLIDTGSGQLRQHLPVIYQETNGKRETVSGHYLLDEKKKMIGFQVDSYDPKLPLVIDPVLSYSTYLGGGTRDEGNGIAVDSAGNAYIVGYTNSANFPMITHTQIAAGDCPPCGNVFVTKLNRAGTAVVYTTVFGGRNSEKGYGIAVDSAGNAYVTGYTFSPDFPTTTGALQTAKHGTLQTFDAFVTKLNPTGDTLLYSTFLGGSRDEQGSGIALDSSGNAVITGYTFSDDFPTTSNAAQPSHGSNAQTFSDAFVTKLNAGGTSLLYSTYLGGAGTDSGNSVAVDTAGNAYVTGKAGVAFPTTSGAYQTAIKGGRDAFVTKLGASDGALLYSTYLGGSSGVPDGIPCSDGCPIGDEGFGIAVDSSGNAYISGISSSADFPTTAGALPVVSYNGTYLFVTKLNAVGNELVYSTLGIGGNSIAVDGSGNAYVTGAIGASNFPLVNAFQSKRKGDFEAYVAELDQMGSMLIYSSFLSGSGGDFGLSIAVDASGDAFITGYTTSDNLLRANPLQPDFGGRNDGTGAENGDAFVAKIAVPVILHVEVKGKKLLITGENFDEGAVILLNNQKQKTANDEQQPDSLLIGKKAGKQITPGQTVILQVRNSDGTLSPEYHFTNTGF